MIETFISRMKKDLYLLTEPAQEAELSSIENRIRQLQENGLSEEEAIRSLGDAQKLVHEIYLKRGIDFQKIRKKRDFFSHQFEELFNAIHHVVDIMSKNSFRENSKIIFNLILLIFIICLIKIPFLFVENIGDSLLQTFSNNTVLLIWGLVIDIAYIFVAIMAFMNIFPKWFSDLKGKGQEKKEDHQKMEMPQKKIEGKELESVSLTNNESKD